MDWLGIVPALCFCGALLLAAAFNLRAPARILAELAIATFWAGPVFVLAVLGGLVGSLILALSAERDTTLTSKNRRRVGWVAFALLLLTVPLMVTQVLYVLVEVD